ncbi:hypothetical protein MCAV_06370 [[Mycoplasma] cavipharyngis]|uniref:hypothetical protein n=1 Tax=[Mycoplasma] cavipharyngis TaxID=92757 RepID=UPI0037041B31
MNNQITTIINKITGIIKTICVFEDGFNGLILNQFQEHFKQKCTIYGWVDQQLKLYQKVFDQKKLLYVKDDQIEFPALTLKVITANIFKKTQDDLILAAIIYQDHAYVALNLMGTYLYECQFQLINNDDHDSKIYSAYTKIIEFILEIISSI